MYPSVWKTKIPPQKKTPYAMPRTKGLITTVPKSSAFFTSFDCVFLWMKSWGFGFLTSKSSNLWLIPRCWILQALNKQCPGFGTGKKTWKNCVKFLGFGGWFVILEGGWVGCLIDLRCWVFGCLGGDFWLLLYLFSKSLLFSFIGRDVKKSINISCQLSIFTVQNARFQFKSTKIKVLCM